jgi:hypothetical protein
MRNIFATFGVSTNPNYERAENDFYATHPDAVRELLKREFIGDVWECACGEGHISEVLKEKPYRKVRSSGLINRGYPGTEVIDFLNVSEPNFLYDIVTNPPYKYAKEFVEKALEISQNGLKVAMLLKLTFLTSKARKPLFEKHPPKRVYVFSERVQFGKNGVFDSKSRNAMEFAWFVWEKGYREDTIVKWI